MTKKEILQQRLNDAIERRVQRELRRRAPQQVDDELVEKLVKRIGVQFVSHLPTQEIFGKISKEMAKPIIEQYKETQNVVKDTHNRALESSRSINEQHAQEIAEYIKQAIHTELQKELNIRGSVEVGGTASVKQEGLAETIMAGFQGLMNFIGRISTRTFFVQRAPEDINTPMKVVMLDPQTMQPIDPRLIGDDRDVRVNVGGSMSTGPKKTGIRGATSVGSGTTTVSTAGTAVQLPDQVAERIFVQAHEDNSGTIVIGDSNVVAAKANRQGLGLFGTQWQEFRVTNLNELWIDSTQDGDKINYFYEQ